MAQRGASVGDIATELRVDETDLAFLDDATAAQRRELLDAITAAAAARDLELRRAVDDALSFIPKPLRGRVVKLLRGGRG